MNSGSMKHDLFPCHQGPSYSATPLLMPSIRVPCSHVLLALALGAAFPTWSQQVPDAGRILQEQQTAPSLPPKAVPGLDLAPPASALPTPTGGPQVTIQELLFSGNTRFDTATLRETLGDVAGQSFDLAGLRKLADRVSTFYRQAGYPFARAFLPSQAVTDGKLRIEIVEGRYGKVEALGDAALTSSAQAFLSPLQSGEVIRSAPLERAISILGDQPGILAVTTVRPGQELGTGDLDVRVERDRRFRGEVGYDNHGNRYTGEHRIRTNVQWDSPFTLGDQITASGTYSDEALWLGNLGYSLPLGSSGLRANVGYARTYYELAKDFSSLDATGSAEISSAGLTYPLLRSQASNLTIGVTVQHKRLKDKRGAIGSEDGKSSSALPITLQFDRRDALAGGGVTYGNFIFTPANLSLDSTLADADRLSGRDTNGRFNKVNINLARLQATAIDALTLFGRVIAQGADKNLDSSEKFSMGGPNGVRAYPVDEGVGDQGGVAQLEIRYALGAFSPYVFHDFGWVQFNAEKAQITPAVTENDRQIAGAGVGVRYTDDALNVGLSIAWRTRGGMPEADTSSRDPRLWLSMAYQF